MNQDYPTIRRQVLEALNAGNAHDAFRLLRPVLTYPNRVADDAELADVLDLFARIGETIAGAEFAAMVRTAAQNLNDPNALYALGYELTEQGLPAIAATLLSRANRLVPGQEALVTELVAALEQAGFHSAACRVLQQVPDLLDTSFICRYLLAFNAIMIGDLTEPRRLLPALQRATDETERFMAARIARMLARADALPEVAPLDSTDLRGWHLVLTGGLLLHLSPYGFDEGMHGRYAYVQDDLGLWREGIERLSAVLTTWQMQPPRLFALPDRESAVLAQATGKRLSLPVEAWPETGSAAPGLIVAYDLEQLDPALLESLQMQRPGQVLWSHATCWTSELLFAADLTTYLYQHNVSPFGERRRVDPETRQMVSIPPLAGSIAEVAQQVSTAEMRPAALDDLPTLVALATAVSALPQSDLIGGLAQSGQRERQWAGSPVGSNRFI